MPANGLEATCNERAFRHAGPQTQPAVAGLKDARSLQVRLGYPVQKFDGPRRRRLEFDAILAKPGRAEEIVRIGQDLWILPQLRGHSRAVKGPQPGMPAKRP